ncbi:protein MAINTENANCE OF MERISTEMS-like [Prunus dulcis]|nr:protein MAINTENANCE OF MERISTEMS-like [Prunus dulcis]
MRMKHKGTEVRPSHQGSRCLKTTVAQGTKGNSSAASSSSKKRTPAKRISGPMGNGVFGVRVFIPRDRNPCSPVLHFDLEEHISFKLTLKKIRGCGNNDICATWYNKAMHDTVKAKVKESGILPFLSILGHGKKGDRPLLVALAERWWDTTHTFHFDEVGEMTMTPTDFAAIIGLHVGGKRLTYDLDIYRNKNKVVKLFGKPIADLLAGERRVPYESLCTPYWRKNPKDDKEADQIARAFILCLIGSSFLNDKSQYVSMHYAPCLEIVSDIGKYDWGGAALACLYRSLDSCSRGRSSSMGGYWRAWEVWACEYLKPFALSRPSGTLNTWLRTLRWVGAKSKRDLQHHLEHFRVMMRHLTNDQVNWNPWGTNESDMPEAVINSVPATRKRILLEGPAGSAWFLG